MLRRVDAPPRLDQLAFINGDRFDRSYRFDVYRRGASSKYLGELHGVYWRTFSFFAPEAGRALAARYANHFPSSTTKSIDSLMHFPAWLARRSIARGRAYLADLAHCELAVTRSWYERDVQRSERRAGDLSLSPHVSLHVCRFALFDPRTKQLLSYREGMSTPRRRRQVLAISRNDDGATVVEITRSELAFLRAQFFRWLPRELRAAVRSKPSANARASLLRKTILRSGDRGVDRVVGRTPGRRLVLRSREE
jgi:hypothetical protein